MRTTSSFLSSRRISVPLLLFQVCFSVYVNLVLECSISVLNSHPGLHALEISLDEEDDGSVFICSF
jgi:hypothetical protein